MEYSNLYNKHLPFVNDNWQGNKCINGRFSNLDASSFKVNFLDILKWQVTRKKHKILSDDKYYALQVSSEVDFGANKDNFIIWLGHATFYIKLGKYRFITDPVFYNIPFVSRLVNLPYNFNEIKADYVLISHCHRDHLDIKSIKTLFKNNEYLELILPLKATRLDKVFDMRSLEMGWFQEYKVNNDLSIIFLPAKHWHRRSLNDFNTVLWGSFLIKYKGLSIYFGGDTAYSPHFKLINSICGNIDYCLLPIGAYKPEKIMQEAHLSPTEAIRAFRDLGGTYFVPMHYSTFDLSDERLDEPLKILQSGLDSSLLRILYIGQRMVIN